MNRSARLGGILALILIACAAVIALDQLHVFSGSSPAATAPTNSAGSPNTDSAGSPSAPPPSTSNDGYGDLK